MLFGMQPLWHFTHPVPEKTAQQCFFNPKCICEPGFYIKLNFWGSLGLNFEYDGGPIIEIGGPIFLYKLRILEGSTSQCNCCPQVSSFEGHVWPPSDFLGGHLKFLRATYYHPICFFTKAELVPIICRNKLALKFREKK